MRKTKALLVGLGLLAFAAAPTQAQFQFGPQVGWGDDADLALGGRVFFGIASLPENITPMVSFNWFIDACEECTWFEFDLGAIYKFTASGTVTPYVAGALNLTRVSIDLGPLGDASDTEIGLTALGGILFNLGSVGAFADGGITLGGGEQLKLNFGVLLGGGGS
jgi:hypothetical protein